MTTSIFYSKFDSKLLHVAYIESVKFFLKFPITCLYHELVKFEKKKKKKDLIIRITQTLEVFFFSK